MAEEAFDIALEKLWIHGGAVIDYAENISRGAAGWRESYLAQREHKQAQFDKMLSYCETATCRMRALVGYFGDAADSRARCGVCDVCAPAASIAQEFRPAEEIERERIGLIIQALRKTDSTGTGKLYTTVFPSGHPDRRSFEDLLGAMARAGLVELADASFEKDGKRIDFRKVRLTSLGREEGESVDVMIPTEAEAPERGRRRKPPSKKKAVKRAKAPAAPKRETPARKPEPEPEAELVLEPAADNSALAAALKAWRLAEAKSKGVPAFRIMTDRTLQLVAAQRPQTTRELISIPGMGLQSVEKYGARIFRIIAQTK